MDWGCPPEHTRWRFGLISAPCRRVRNPTDRRSRLWAGCARLGPPRSCFDDAPRMVAAVALGNEENNPFRMDDPGDRRLGLPVHSAAVESPIKPMDRRMKRPEAFWNEG